MCDANFGLDDLTLQSFKVAWPAPWTVMAEGTQQPLTLNEWALLLFITQSVNTLENSFTKHVHGVILIATV